MRGYLLLTDPRSTYHLTVDHAHASYELGHGDLLQANSFFWGADGFGAMWVGTDPRFMDVDGYYREVQGWDRASRGIQGIASALDTAIGGAELLHGGLTRLIPDSPSAGILARNLWFDEVGSVVHNPFRHTLPGRRPFDVLFEPLDIGRHQLLLEFMDDATDPRATTILPDFDGTTYGLITPLDPPGPSFVLPSSSRTGARFPYSQADGHLETLTARWMSENGVLRAMVEHNHPGGTCPNCNSWLPAFLDENSVLIVVPPSNAVAPSPRWITIPKMYKGNSKSPY